MKSSLKHLNEALAFHLEAMYDAEKKLQRGLAGAIALTKHAGLKAELKKYQSSSTDKRTKLKRVFSYLLAGPFKRKNPVIDAMLATVKAVSKVGGTPQLRDVMILTSVNELVQYKIAAYRTGLILADQLDLGTARDLLDEILQWEKESGNALGRIAITSIHPKAKDVTLPAL